MAYRLRSLLWTWFPVLLWLGIIVFESTNLMSSDKTGDVLYRLLKAIFGTLGHRPIEVLNHVLRKTGHFTGYGILGLLFFRAIRRTVLEVKPAASATGTIRQRMLRWGCEAIVCTAIVAALDEWHQTFLPSRTGAFHDVVLDTLGAIVLMIVVIIRYSRAPHTSEAE